jgi:hypothetical protein
MEVNFLDKGVYLVVFHQRKAPLNTRMLFWALFDTVFTFAPMLATNRLLTYLEDPASSTVTPYVWVVALLVIPIMNSLSIQQYFVSSIQLTSNAKAALIQALYEKTLRVRMVGAPKGAEEVERNRVGRINNLFASDMYRHFQS